MTKIIIIEDEVLAANRLESLIHALLPDAQIIHKIETVQESLQILKSDIEYDLLFMDIHLADGNSFDILDEIQIKKPIIFITAYDKYALPAFRHFVIDYLLKPIRKAELKAAIDKYQQLFPLTIAESKKWTLKIGSHIKIINHNHIAYYFTVEKINYAMANDGKKYPIDLTLDQIVAEIDPKLYYRINRQFIVSRGSVLQIRSHTKSRFIITIIHNSEQLIVSNERAPGFKKWLSM